MIRPDVSSERPGVEQQAHESKDADQRDDARHHETEMERAPVVFTLEPVCVVPILDDGDHQRQESQPDEREAEDSLDRRALASRPVSVGGGTEETVTVKRKPIIEIAVRTQAMSVRSAAMNVRSRAHSVRSMASALASGVCVAAAPVSINPPSLHRLRFRERPRAVQNLWTRTIEPHHVVPARRDRQAVRDLAVAAAELNRHRAVGVLLRGDVVERVGFRSSRKYPSAL